MMAVLNSRGLRWLRTHRAYVAHGFVSILALAALAVMIWLNLLLWLVPHLGFASQSTTGIVRAVERESSAGRAGLQSGDRILRIYDLSWQDAVEHPLLFRVMGHFDKPIFVTVSRNGAIVELTLQPDAPSFAFQLEKVINAVLALLCWVVGAQLAVIRRREASGSVVLGTFWLVLSAVIGSYLFAYYASLALQIILQVAIVFLAPLAIAIHVWYPARTRSRWTVRRTWALLRTSWIVFGCALASMVLVLKPTAVQLVSYLGLFQAFAVALACVGSATLLARAHRRTRIAHVQRQIRLIAFACGIVALVWFGVFAILRPLSAIDVSQHWNIAISLIPLAYLAGGITPDLDRLDRLAGRLAIHVLTIGILGGALLLVLRVSGIAGPLGILSLAVAFVLLYRPLQRVAFRTLPLVPQDRYRPLYDAMSTMTTTLEPTILHRAIIEGVRATFGAPPLAFFASESQHAHTIILATSDRMTDLPLRIAGGRLTRALSQYAIVIEAQHLYRGLASAALRDDEEQAIHQRGVVLWCPIVHVHGALLGVLLLGRRPNGDPYRDDDLRELRRLLAAATLALTNSAAYEQQREAEATIRRLYQQAHEAHDSAAAAFARELHDEVINVNVRLNIEALTRLVPHVNDPWLRQELNLVLESEHTTIETLRLLCEQLHPTGLDDPWGLASVLRMQVEQVQPLSSAHCRLQIEGEPQPIASKVQAHVMRIAREALTNALKHAQATEITTLLRYPEHQRDVCELVVTDDGIGLSSVAARPGHWGLRSMQERARLIGGTLTIERGANGGTRVTARFPALQMSEANT
jgi:signal transduction histidine kinase